MECNKDEAIRAKAIAEKKMENNDFEGARKIALRAQSLYPEIDNISQLLSICNVHCSAQNRVFGSEKDWYGILQVEKLADESTVKKQYRRLALILHPDKNRFPGAEGAFKLICEANAVLSDPTKKSAYDSRVRVSVRSASINPPPNHTNKISPLHKQYGAQINVSNGFSSLNQHEASQSTSSVKQEVFWTSCPYCGVRYQYLRQFIGRSLRCQACSKVFVGYETSVQGASLGSKVGEQGAQHMPSKHNMSQPAAFREKEVQNQGSCKVGIQNDKGPPASHTGSQGTASRKTVRQKPGCWTESGAEGIKMPSAAKVSGDLKAKKADISHANSLNSAKEGGTSDGDAIKSETGEPKNKCRKRGRKLVADSSESFDTSSESEVEDVTMRRNVGDHDTDLKSESSDVHILRRSSRRRQHVSYNEADEDGLASLKKAQASEEGEEKVPKEPLDGEDVKHDTKHGNQTKFCNDANYSMPKSKELGADNAEESLRERDAGSHEGGRVRGETEGKSDTTADTVEIESDCDQDADLCHCPDPEFGDFEKERDEKQFAVGQFWACYDTMDGMPRFYAKVHKVSISPFNLSIKWLEAVPIDGTFKKWVKRLPVGCGSFKFGNTEQTSVRLSFSHQVHCDKGKKRSTFVIYPREGEVWALFKDWDINWSSNPEDHKEFKYEIVEVLSAFVDGTGVKVGYLDKVTGFVSLFQRASQNDNNSFLIGPKEMYKFSHRVPCFKMTGSEREGVPVGSFELDPAALPLNPVDLYYPGKARLEVGNMAPVDKNNGKSAASEGMSTPQKFVDVEGIDEEIPVLRRSPRGVNARPNMN